jgi:hypothetical protein
MDHAFAAILLGLAIVLLPIAVRGAVGLWPRQQGTPHAAQPQTPRRNLVPVDPLGGGRGGVEGTADR